MQRDTENEPGVTRWLPGGVRVNLVLPILGVLAALALLVLAANFMGSFRSEASFDIAPPPAPVISEPPMSPAPVGTPVVPASTDALSSAVVPVLVALLVVVALVILVVILRRLRGRNRDRSYPAPDGLSMGTAIDDQALPPLQDAFAKAVTALANNTDSGDAIILCWLALETGAEQAGLPRQASETSTEFTAALLNRFHPESEDTATLLGLYQRARFGVTEQQRSMGPEDLRSARMALASLRRSLDSANGVREGAP